MGGGKANMPSPVNNMMPSIGGVQLPNPLNPIPPEQQMIAGAKGGKGGNMMDPVSAMGGGKSDGKDKEKKDSK